MTITKVTREFHRNIGDGGATIISVCFADGSEIDFNDTNLDQPLGAIYEPGWINKEDAKKVELAKKVAISRNSERIKELETR